MLKKAILLIFIILFVSIISCESDEGTPTIPPVTNHNPNSPNTPTPVDGAVDIIPPVTLKWKCTDPDADDTLKYDVYVGDLNPPTEKIGSNLINAAYDLGIPPAGSLIYWKIVAKDNHGATTVSSVWSFRVKAGY